jgi:hypothetical protein
MKDVVYKESILARNSEAFALWDAWQKEKKDRNAAQKKLDQHMKQLDVNARELLTRYDK